MERERRATSPSKRKRTMETTNKCAHVGVLVLLVLLLQLFLYHRSSHLSSPTPKIPSIERDYSELEQELANLLEWQKEALSTSHALEDLGSMADRFLILKDLDAWDRSFEGGRKSAGDEERYRGIGREAFGELWDQLVPWVHRSKWIKRSFDEYVSPV
jgi:hypothetical protein